MTGQVSVVVQIPVACNISVASNVSVTCNVSVVGQIPMASKISWHISVTGDIPWNISVAGSISVRSKATMMRRKVPVGEVPVMGIPMRGVVTRGGKIAVVRGVTRAITTGLRGQAACSHIRGVLPVPTRVSAPPVAIPTAHGTFHFPVWTDVMVG